MAYQSEIEFRVKVIDAELKDLEKRIERVQNPFKASGAKRPERQTRENLRIEKERLDFVKKAVEDEERLRIAKARNTQRVKQRLLQIERANRIKAAKDVARAEEALARQKARQREDLALGVGFPLLFGGGAGAVAGGALGAIAGGGKGGFGLQILFSALGQQVDSFFAGVQESATSVAAALDGTSASLEAVKEAGIVVQDSTIKYIQDLEDSGRSLDAYNAVQRELNSIYGTTGVTVLKELKGANEFANTEAGKLSAVLQTELAPVFILLAQLGGGAARALREVIPAIADAIGEFTLGIPGATTTAQIVRQQPGFDQERIDANVRQRDQELKTDVEIQEITASTEALRRQTKVAKLSNDLTDKRVVALRRLSIETEAQNKISALEEKQLADMFNGDLKRLTAAKIQKIEQQKTLDLAKLQTSEQKAIATASEQAAKEQKRLADAAAREEARIQQRLDAIEVERKAILEISGFKDKIAAAEAANDSQLVIRLQGEQRIAEIEAKRRSELTKVTKQRLIDAINIKSATQKLAAQRETERQITEEQRKRQELFDTTIEDLEHQLRITEATSQAERDRLRIARELKKLEKQGFSGSQLGQAESVMKRLAVAQQPLNAFIRKSTEDLNNLQQVAVDVSQGIGNAIGDSLVNGLQSLITGAASIKQVFANLLKSVADVLANTAAKMIAQYIAIGIARAFAGMGTGGGETPPTTLPGASVQTGGGLNINGIDQFIAPPTLASSGGYFGGPTNALVGEGGESEYIIPESKMRESMARYSRGARGSSVIPEAGGSGTSGEGGGVAVAAPIDVRYSVERINSVDYVTADQFQQGMQQAATQGAKQGEQQTLKRLQMSGSTRRRIGI